MKCTTLRIVPSTVLVFISTIITTRDGISLTRFLWLGRPVVSAKKCRGCGKVGGGRQRVQTLSGDISTNKAYLQQLLFASAGSELWTRRDRRTRSWPSRNWPTTLNFKKRGLILHRYSCLVESYSQITEMKHRSQLTCQKRCFQT